LNVYTETLPVVLLFSVRACDVHFDLCINVQRCAGVFVQQFYRLSATW